MHLDSDRATVRELKVEDTGGTKLHADASNIGIEVSALHCEIIGNEVVETYPTDCGESVGISQSSDRVAACEIGNNRIANSRLPVCGRTFGVRTNNKTIVRANTIETMTYAISIGGAAVIEGNTLIGEAYRGQYRSNTFDYALDNEAIKKNAGIGMGQRK